MRNYIDPEMNIAMFESENVVVTDSAVKQANDFLTSNEAGAVSKGVDFDTKAVSANNILDFTK